MGRLLPSLRALAAFEAAARRGTFSAAARDMSLSQGAISRQIIGLEADLGVPLFSRHGTRIALTEEGRRFLHAIAPLLDGLSTAVDKARARTGVHGKVVLATYPTLAARWLTVRALDCEATLGIALRVETVLANSELRPDHCDLAILQGEPPFERLRSVPLMPERLVLVGAPGLVANLPPGPFGIATAVVLRHATRLLSLGNWCEGTGLSLVDPTEGPVFDRYDAMIEATIERRGLAVLPDVLIRREMASGALVLAYPHVAVPAAAYHLCWPRGRVLPPEAGMVRDHLVAGAAGDLNAMAP